MLLSRSLLSLVKECRCALTGMQVPEDEEYLLVSLRNGEDCIIPHDFETKNYNYLFWLNACITLVY